MVICFAMPRVTERLRTCTVLPTLDAMACQQEVELFFQPRVCISCRTPLPVDARMLCSGHRRRGRDTCHLSHMEMRSEHPDSQQRIEIETWESCLRVQGPL
eukprot:PhF_6_TR8518/c1_g1_i1/m.13337